MGHHRRTMAIVAVSRVTAIFVAMTWAQQSGPDQNLPVAVKPSIQQIIPDARTNHSRCSYQEGFAYNTHRAFV